MSADTSAPLLGVPLPVELMNTVWADRDGVHDSLAGPADAIAWLRAVAPHTEIPAGELSGPMGDTEAGTLTRDLRDLRDALRRLAAGVTGDPRPVTQSGARASAASQAGAVATVNRAAAAAPTWPELTWPDGGPATRRVRSQGPASRALLSAIAAQAVELFAGAGQAQLKACLAPGCVLYFLQHHPRREWCSAGCGNRARVARHYRRHHGHDDGTRKQLFTTP